MRKCARPAALKGPPSDVAHVRLPERFPIMSRSSPSPRSREDEMRPLYAAFVLCALVPPVAAADARKTPLDDYLAKPDKTYAWKLVKAIPGDGVTTFVL